MLPAYKQLGFRTKPQFALGEDLTEFAGASALRGSAGGNAMLLRTKHHISILSVLQSLFLHPFYFVFSALKPMRAHMTS